MASSAQTSDDKLMAERVVELDGGQLGHVPAHPHVAGARVEQTCLRSQLEPLDDEVDDRSRPPAKPRQRLKGMLHSGASPLAWNSSTGTRNMPSACCRCSASQLTTVPDHRRQPAPLVP